VSSNKAKAQSGRLTEPKAQEILELENNGVTEPDTAADYATADIADSADDIIGTQGASDRSLTEASVSEQMARSDGEDTKVLAHQEVKKPSSEVYSQNQPANASGRDTDLQRSGQKRKIVAAKLCKKNGIISDIEKAVESAVEKIQSEKSTRSEELAALTTKSPGKRSHALVVNGFHSSASNGVATRRRSALQECSQTAVNTTMEKHEMTVSGTMVETVTAILDEMVDSRGLRQVNGKELVLDNIVVSDFSI